MKSSYVIHPVKKSILVNKMGLDFSNLFANQTFNEETNTERVLSSQRLNDKAVPKITGILVK